MPRFDPKKAQMLDSEWRKKYFPPEKVMEFISSLGMKKNVAFDIGSGTGYLTIPLARMFKKVYAVEANEEMAEILRKRLEDEKILNVGIIISPTPPDVDFKINLALFSNVLHELEKPEEYLSWASRSDYVVVAEWKKEEAEFGPPLNERISLEELLEMSGMKLIKIEELKYHYLAALKKF